VCSSCKSDRLFASSTSEVARSPWPCAGLQFRTGHWPRPLLLIGSSVVFTAVTYMDCILDALRALAWAKNMVWAYPRLYETIVFFSRGTRQHAGLPKGAKRTWGLHYEGYRRRLPPHVLPQRGSLSPGPCSYRLAKLLGFVHMACSPYHSTPDLPHAGLETAWLLPCQVRSSRPLEDRVFAGSAWPRTGLGYLQGLRPVGTHWGRSDAPHASSQPSL
jgi:hypothetical protein